MNAKDPESGNTVVKNNKEEKKKKLPKDGNKKDKKPKQIKKSDLDNNNHPDNNNSIKMESGNSNNNNSNKGGKNNNSSMNESINIEDLKMDALEIIKNQATINLATLGHVSHGKTTLVGGNHIYRSIHPSIYLLYRFLALR